MERRSIEAGEIIIIIIKGESENGRRTIRNRGGRKRREFFR